MTDELKVNAVFPLRALKLTSINLVGKERRGGS